MTICWGVRKRIVFALIQTALFFGVGIYVWLDMWEQSGGKPAPGQFGGSVFLGASAALIFTAIAMVIEDWLLRRRTRRELGRIPPRFVAEPTLDQFGRLVDQKPRGLNRLLVRLGVYEPGQQWTRPRVGDDPG